MTTSASPIILDAVLRAQKLEAVVSKLNDSVDTLTIPETNTSVRYTNWLSLWWLNIMAWRAYATTAIVGGICEGTGIPFAPKINTGTLTRNHFHPLLVKLEGRDDTRSFSATMDGIKGWFEYQELNDYVVSPQSSRFSQKGTDFYATFPLFNGITAAQIVSHLATVSDEYYKDPYAYTRAEAAGSPSKVEKGLLSFFGKDFYTIDQPYSRTIEITPALLKASTALFSFEEMVPAMIAGGVSVGAGGSGEIEIGLAKRTAADDERPTIDFESLDGQKAGSKFLKEIVENSTASIRIFSSSVTRTNIHGSWGEPPTREDNSAIVSYNPKDGEQSVELLEFVNTHRKIEVHVSIKVPLEAVKFMTQMEKPTVERFATHMLARYNKEVGSDEDPQLYSRQVDAIAPLSEKKVAALPHLRRASYKVGDDKKPSASYGMTVDEDGRPIYIPPINNLPVYYKALEAIRKNDPQSEFYVSDVLDHSRQSNVFGKDREYSPRPALKVPGNMVLYVDWANSVLVYSDQIGTVKTIPIGSVRPVSIQHAHRYLNLPLFGRRIRGRDVSAFFGSFVVQTLMYVFRNRVDRAQLHLLMDKYKLTERMAKIVFQHDPVKQQGATAAQVLESVHYGRGGTAINLEQMVDTWANQVSYAFSRLSPEDKLKEEFSWMDNTGDGKLDPKEWRVKDLRPSSPDPMLALLSVMIRTLNESIDADLQGYLSERSVVQGLREIAVIKIMARFAPNMKGVMAEYAKVEKAYATARKGYDKSYKPAPIAGIRVDEADPSKPGKRVKSPFKYMPHQSRVDMYMSEHPKHAILNVQAGGGKTLSLVVADFMRLLMAGLVERGLFVMPGYLPKNYIDDVNYAFQGRMNVVVLNTADTKNYTPHSDVGALGLEGMAKLIMSSPPNTLFVTDYGFISQHHEAESAVYGDSVVGYNNNLNLLLEIGFDYVAFDESQDLRNESSEKHVAGARLAAQAKYSRLSTGTLMYTRIEDLRSQMKMLDPTAFGTLEEFVQEFASSTDGSGRIIDLSPESISAIQETLATHSAYVQVRRREWASLLPDRNQIWHIVSIDEDKFKSYRTLYDGVLKRVLDEINKALKENKKLKKAFDKALEDENETGGDGDNPALEAALKPYIQRLERLLVHPERDRDLMEIMKGRVDFPLSPKVDKVISICRDHMKGVTAKEAQRRGGDAKPSDPIPGKIMVFCEYEDTCEGIYENMPPELKAMCIPYKASTKDQDLLRFKTDPDKKILIGIAESLSTGHNLQFVSRIIRVEAVWSPGKLEQGEARIWRPEPKSDSRFNEIYYDWVVVNGTIDITKTARLVSRLVVNTFLEEKGNPRYDAAALLMKDDYGRPGSLPLVPMTLANIEHFNWFVSPKNASSYRELGNKNLYPYLVAVKAIDEARKKEYEDYRNDPKNPTTPVEVPAAPVLKGSKLLLGVPLLLGQTLPNQNELGLMRYSEFVTEATRGDPDAVHTFDITGRKMYTTEGVGIAIKHRGNKVTVQINGVAHSFDKLDTFVFSDPDVDPQRLIEATGLKEAVWRDGSEVKDIPGRKAKQGIIKKAGRPASPETKLPVKEPKAVKPVKKGMTKNEDTEDNDAVEVVIQQYNHMLSVSVSLDDPTVEKYHAKFKALGFVRTPKVMFTEVPNWRALDSLNKKLSAAYRIPKERLDDMERMEELFQSARSRLFNIEAIPNVDFIHFYRENKTPKKADELYPYFIAENESLFLVVNAEKNQAVSTLKSKTRGIPGVEWDMQEPRLAGFYDSVAEAVADLKKMQGFVSISNKEEVKSDLKDVVIYKRKKKKGK